MSAPGLPSWARFREYSPEWVAMLQVLVRDGRRQSAGRFARRYRLNPTRTNTRFCQMAKRGLLDREKGWDGWMYAPTEHGRKVAERGW